MQEIYRQGTSLADALILCTALGGVNNKGPPCVVCYSIDFVIIPPKNTSTDFAYLNLRVFLSIISSLVLCRVGGTGGMAPSGVPQGPIIIPSLLD